MAVSGELATANRQTTAMLVCSCFKMDPCSNTKAFARVNTGTSRGLSYLTGVIADVNNMEEYLQKKRIDRFDVWWVRTTDDDMKGTFIFKLSQFFQQQDKKEFILYYSGHGTEEAGNWVLGMEGPRNKSVVTVGDIAVMWDQFHKPSDTLLIIADCCHSGKWVEKLDELENNSILMNSSCGADETCTETPAGGDFTRWLIAVQQYEPEVVAILQLATIRRRLTINKSKLSTPFVLKNIDCFLTESHPKVTATVTRRIHLVFHVPSCIQVVGSKPPTRRVPGGVLLITKCHCENTHTCENTRQTFVVDRCELLQ